MDREFMEKYFDTNYEDSVGDFTKGCAEYEEYMKNSQAAANKLLEACGGIQNELWKLHEECMNQLMLAELPLIRLAYLQGALDRERMLR